MKLLSIMGLAALSLTAACVTTSPNCQGSANDLRSILANRQDDAAEYAKLESIRNSAAALAVTEPREQLLCQATAAEAAMTQLDTPLEARLAATNAAPASEPPLVVALRTAQAGVGLCSALESEDADRCAIVHAIAATAPSRAAMDQLVATEADAASTADAAGWRRAEGIVAEFSATTQQWTPTLERATATSNPTIIELTRRYFETTSCGVHAAGNPLRERSPGDAADVQVAASGYAAAFQGAMSEVVDDLDIQSVRSAECQADSEHFSCDEAPVTAVGLMCMNLQGFGQ